MQHTNVTLSDVNAVYDGAEGLLWELIMGEQIHIGGFASSKKLADAAGIKAGMKGLDLCSALGAGCRFLVKHYGVTMCGLDATMTMHEKAEERALAEGLADRIQFRMGDVTEIPWPDNTFDFVWGEDAWCYVVDKSKLISEAARVLKPGGLLVFTDWIEGPAGLTEVEAGRINTFMKFPYMESVPGYRRLMESAGLQVVSAEADSDTFARHVDLYLNMLTMQLTYDALKLIGDNLELFQAMGGEMVNMGQAARAGKIAQGRFIARK
ncbi:MAG: methyltransferase domain-containing protein [Candidatus Zixiibacteriota bacterium]|nr:MAG: methyltransferase domain-containing protein [candidate division Zixibacteria bacterium]